MLRTRFTERFGLVGPVAAENRAAATTYVDGLLDGLGWPLAGALLFWGCAWALGSRRLVRDPLIAVTLSFASYFLFAGASVFVDEEEMHKLATVLHRMWVSEADFHHGTPAAAMEV